MMIWALVLIFIILLVWAGAVVLPILTPTLHDVGSITTEALHSANDPAITQATDASIVPATETLNNMEWISYTLMILMFMAFLVMCFYVRTYPFLIWIWIIMIVVMIFVSIYLTVAYQNLRNDPMLGSYYKEWGNTDFVLRNLPIVIFVLGVVGGIIMFMIPKDTATEQAGGGVPL